MPDPTAPSPPLVFDHVAIACAALDDGTAHVRDALGTDVPPGGTHPAMATHNRLMRLGDREFLEVIAVDPEAPAPDRPRWFALDRFQGRPRIGTWVLGTPDIDASLAQLRERLPAVTLGRPVEIARGDLTWLISVPDDGSMPLDGAFPTLIQWPEGPHPAGRMMGDGYALRELIIEHPCGEEIAAALDGLLDDRRIAIRQGPTKAIKAAVATPNGDGVLT